MNTLTKQLTALIGAIVVIGALYYGTYLPFRKGQLLIDSIRDTRLIKTTDDFKKNFSKILDFKSPVGQGESVRQVGSMMVSLLTGQQNISKSLAEELINFSEFYFQPLIKNNLNSAYAQNFLTIGQIYQVAGLRLSDEAYLQKAISYYQKGLGVSPRRPQFLYNLFFIYYNKKDFAEAEKIGREILTYWPNDEKVKSMLENLGR